jgi:hypothetical protein
MATTHNAATSPPASATERPLSPAATTSPPASPQQQAFVNPHLAALPPPPKDRFDVPTAVALAAAAFEAYLEPRGAAQRLRREQRWSPAATPSRDDGKLAAGSAKLTFVDADFLKAAYSGVLELRLLSAKGLRGVNRVGGKSDPYCVASLPDAGGRVSTHVVWNALNPVWYDAEEAAQAEADAKKALAGGSAAEPASNRKAPAPGRARTHVLYVRRDPRTSASDPSAGVRFTVYDKAGMLTGATGGSKGDVELGTAALAVSDFLPPAGSKANGAWVKKNVLMCGAQATGALEVEARYLPFSAKRGAGVAFLGDHIADEGPAVPGPAPEAVKAAAADLAAGGKGGGGEAAAVGDAASLLGGKGSKAGALGKLGGLFGGKGIKAGAEASVAPPPTTPAAAAAAAQPPAQQPAADAREMADAWRAVTKAAGRVMHVRGDRGGGKKGGGSDYRAVAFVNSLASDTECWIGRSLSAREVVVAFRGTEQTKIKDALSDMNAFPVPYGLEEEVMGTAEEAASLLGGGAAAAEGAAASGAGSASGGGGVGGAGAGSGGGGGGAGAAAKRLVTGAASADKVYVHAGFLSAWRSVKALVLSAVASAIESAAPGNGGGGGGGGGGSGNGGEPWTVYVTGHSLGGSLATLATYDLLGLLERAQAQAQAQQQQQQQAQDQQQQGLLRDVRCPVDVCMYTYGAPRVGNVAFALNFHGRVERAAERARARGGAGSSNRPLPAAWRLLNERDLVPTIPRLMGYAHVPYGVKLPADADANATARDKAGKAVAEVLADERRRAAGAGSSSSADADAAAAEALTALERCLIFEPATGTDALGEGRDAATLASDAAKSARAAFAAKGGGFSLGAIGAAANAAAGAVGGAALVEQEKRIARALTDGSAVLDHLEGPYLGKLVRALGAAGVQLPPALVDKFGGGSKPAAA